jgi:hypothetical protein
MELALSSNGIQPVGRITCNAAPSMTALENEVFDDAVWVRLRGFGTVYSPFNNARSA